MKILTTAQIQQWDKYTIENEPINSYDLMERAAGILWERILEEHDTLLHSGKPLYIFCGMGNNGGDGLSIGRMARQSGINALIYMVFYSDTLSPDCDRNYRLLEDSGDIMPLCHSNDLPEITQGAIVIDAIFGIGLNKYPDEFTESVIRHINLSDTYRIAVDIPSGLFADIATEGDAIVKASVTYTFQTPKLAFFLAQNGGYVGKWEVLDIGLHSAYIQGLDADYYCLTKDHIRSLLKTRKKFSHKGDYGHALLAAGSKGKIGAAALAGKACIRSGAGLVTMMIPECGYSVIQISVPEAMVITDDHSDYLTFSNHLNLSQYNAIGIGPGLGMNPETQNFLREVFIQMPMRSAPSIVLDADALNLIAADMETRKLLPENAILTPHPKELERLIGKTSDEWQRLLTAQTFARENKVYIVLKGAHTQIITPYGETWFNTTGNPGMATAGMGDVLTGVLTGLLGQGYTPLQACLIGVFWHGLAGDIYAKKYFGEEETLIASDVIACMPKALKEIRGNSNPLL